MEYPTLSVARRHPSSSQRRSPVINSSITKRQSSHNTSPHAKRWSMYDGNIFAAAANAMNYSLDSSMPRVRPSSMLMAATPVSSVSTSAASYMAVLSAPSAAPVVTSPLSEPISDNIIFSPGLAMSQQQQQQDFYSPASYTYMTAPQYARTCDLSHQQQQQQQQQQCSSNYSDYPPTLPDSVPSSFDISAMSMPGFEAPSSATRSPQFTAPLTPDHMLAPANAMSVGLASANGMVPFSIPSAVAVSTSPSAVVDADEDSGEILHGMGLYDDDALVKDGVDLALDSSRDCMQSLLADTTRAAQPTKMLLMKDFEPEATDDEDETEAEAEQAGADDNEDADAAADAAAALPVVQEQQSQIQSLAQPYFQPTAVYAERIYPVQPLYTQQPVSSSWI
ncbi:hypothetical protein CFO_g2960 [Ceratocystis platani]|uniref:Uncharacterized protein n=1 Tax=Ceratocystis fimbriata f. sp. platani TaxID=88771 RepID=A0A0F8B3K5_CERFI|nr:hypothetical protein CFO_g2960 [Ceratocystis platani]